MTNVKEMKMTNRKALEFVLENCEVPQEVQEKILAMISALDRKNSATRKPTAGQLENEKFKELILTVLTTEKGMTITDIIKTVPEFDGFNNQKIVALVGQLKKENKVVRQENKGRAYFFKA